MREYKRSGFKTAIDDFGAGYAGLKLLSDFQPDIIKIDMDLVRHVDTSRPRQAIVRNLARLCEEMGITVIAGALKRRLSAIFVADCGIRLMQGYLFANLARAMAPLREETFAPALSSPAGVFQGCGTRPPANPEGLDQRRLRARLGVHQGNTHRCW